MSRLIPSNFIFKQWDPINKYDLNPNTKTGASRAASGKVRWEILHAVVTEAPKRNFGTLQNEVWKISFHSPAFQHYG